MNRLLVSTVVALSLVAAWPLAGTGAQDASPAAAPPLVTAAQLGLPELPVTRTATGYDLPATVAAGRYLVTLTNTTDDVAYAQFLEAPADRTVDQVKAEIDATNADTATEADFAWVYDATLVGGALAAGGQVGQGIVDLTPGHWLVFDLRGEAELGELDVTGAMPVTLAEPASDTTFTAIGTATGYDFAIDGTLTAGVQLIKFVNKSDQPHFIYAFTSPVPLTDETFTAVMSLPDGATPAADSGLPSFDQLHEVGESPVISAAKQTWWIVKLEPGHYTFTCWITDSRNPGTPHAMEGMVEFVEVK